jgi:hypothetical protein
MKDRSRPGEGGSDKTIAAVNTIISTAHADPRDEIAHHVDRGDHR